MMKILRAISAVLVSIVTLSISTGCSVFSNWDNQLGPSDSAYLEGRLAPCPDKPNCVSTQATNREQLIVPFTYSKPLPEAKEALRAVLSKMPRTDIRKEDGVYLHVEFRTAVMRFVDDVEFLFDEQTKTLQFRSGSRVGYSDWSVNRKRMEEIRNQMLGKI
jgi:uncharacterized protein (DUF1499 family)